MGPFDREIGTFLLLFFTFSCDDFQQKQIKEEKYDEFLSLS
jgi:hypothetical protein